MNLTHSCFWWETAGKSPPFPHAPPLVDMSNNAWKIKWKDQLILVQKNLNSLPMSESQKISHKSILWKKNPCMGFRNCTQMALTLNSVFQELLGMPFCVKRKFVLLEVSWEAHRGPPGSLWFLFCDIDFSLSESLQLIFSVPSWDTKSWDDQIVKNFLNSEILPYWSKW